jgi:predicted nucleic acid-binding protein
MSLIVCDTGPILHLQEARLLELLQKAGKVYIPRMVELEVNELYPLWRKHRPEWITIEPLLPDETEQAESLFLSGLLGFGEAEAIILAKRLKPQWFLTDDTEARIFASSLGMEVHGSLGIVLWSTAVGHLSYSESKEALERLSKTSLWISKDILSEAQKALKTMFRKS